RFWRRDTSSREAYERSIQPNRETFRAILGVVDRRLPAWMERFGDDENPALVAEAPSFRVFQVRWPVLEGVHGEGLLLEPRGEAGGDVAPSPDRRQTPARLAGLAAGIEPASQFARRLASAGFRVIVPTPVSRDIEASGNPRIAMTNQPHREWIYRQAYQMGRHVIGYEVQKVLAAVDSMKRRSEPGTKVGVAGYGEGGVIAFHAAAVDSRIAAALVS